MLELYVSGTEQNSGKTFITAGIAATMQCLGYSTSVYKPVQTNAIEKNGFVQAPDLAYVKFIDPYIKTYFSYLLTSNAAPVLAAGFSGIEIKRDKILQDYEQIFRESECIITDGCQGITAPLSVDMLETDLIKALGLPVLIVISPEKTSVNNIIMTLNYAKSLEIPVRGVILNEYPDDTTDLNVKNLTRLVEEYTDAKVLGIMPHLENLRNIKPDDLITNILYGIDVESVFNIKIAKLSM